MKPVMPEALGAALADLETISNAQINLMAAHWELLCQWNLRSNLTTILDPNEAAHLHYRDSLEVLPFLSPGSVADIGSGAGFPGVPIAIVGDYPVTLVEPRRKRGLSKLRLSRSHNARSTQRRLQQFPRRRTRDHVSSGKGRRRSAYGGTRVVPCTL